jgi:hypothetical protein
MVNTSIDVDNTSGRIVQNVGKDDDTRPAAWCSLHHAFADKDAVPYRFFNDVTAQALKNVERLVKDHLNLGTTERGDLKLLPHTQPHVQFWNLGSGKLHCTREEVIKEVSSQHYIHLCLYTTRLVHCGIGCYDI